MPDVVGLQLDVAKSDIERAGFDGDVEIVGGGLFGVVDDSNWVVCEQGPAAGESLAEPRLIVERECATESVPEPDPVESSASPEPSEAPVVVEATATTVDEFVDRLNSADMGGIQLGDRFRFTGELVGSDFWSTGATGDYSVYFVAQGGANDLLVLVDESLVDGWTDGTVLDVVVENVERTVSGETYDGWPLIVEATVIE